MSIVVLLRAVSDPELAGGIRGSSYRLDAPSEDAIALGLSLRSCSPAPMRGVAIGPPEWEMPLRDAVSLGLDEVERLWGPSPAAGDIVAHARLLACALSADARAVIAGGVATDHGSGLIPFALAELLGWPVIERTIDAGIEGADLVVRALAGGGRRTTYRMPGRAVLVAASGRALPYPTVARKLAARRAAVLTVTPPAAQAAEPAFTFEGFGPARPVTRHLLRPSTASGAGGRLRHLMAGGAAPSGQARGAMAADASVATQLADLLDREGLLD